MIASLRGSLLWRDGAEVCLEVGGVGYRVTVLPTTSATLGEVGHGDGPSGDVFLHIHHHVREDAQVLFGFATRDEREVFEVLIGTHGVGPALALAILGVHPPEALVRVVANEDLAALCLVPGVGRKTGARLLVELANRFDGWVGSDGAAVMPATAGAGSSIGSDVHDALASLGYAPDEIAAAVRDLPDDADAGELLRLALQRLAVV